MTSHKAVRALTSFAAALAAAGAIAACGGATPAKTGTGTAKSGFTAIVDDAYRYAACMRHHGITNFPDPHVVNTSTQHTLEMDRPVGVVPGSPKLKAAAAACRHVMPPQQLSGQNNQQQRQHTAAMLAFASCMRRHGFSRFPDPDSTGQLTLAMVTAAGIQLQQPAVKTAAYACAPLTHGSITRADINHATAGGGSTP